MQPSLNFVLLLLLLLLQLLLQELPDSCSQLHQLQDLHLEVPLNHLPSVSHLTSLKRLFIGHVTKEITSLTHQIGHLAELESLSLLGWPGLQQLPEGLGDLASLTQLVLRECGQLMALPGCLGRLRSLKRLVLQGGFQLAAICHKYGFECVGCTGIAD